MYLCVYIYIYKGPPPREPPRGLRADAEDRGTKMIIVGFLGHFRIPNRKY